MEGNSCSSNSFDAVNVKNEHEYGFNEQVHVKEEVVECLKEEAAWEDSAAAGEAAELASLYAGHEVKDELVLGPEGLQPRDEAFPLYGHSARARGCHRDLTYARTDGPPEVLARAGGQRGGRGVTRGGGSAGERAHCCQTCNHTFTTPSILKRHERIHTGERPHSCEICKQKFMQLSHLKNHERTHTGEKPFSCRTCNKKFTCLSNLKRHERVHTGDRPFSCRTCKQKFSETGSLKRHERIHTGKKPYTCDVCKMQFTYLVSLKNHKDRIHADRKPF